MALFGSTVRVTYIDADTDAVISASNVSSRKLPETYDYESVVRVGGYDCQVIRATPRTKPEFVREGTLLLQVRRLDLMQPMHQIYGFPTLCTDLVEPGAAPANRHTLRIKQDRWRQLEFISHDLTVTVNNEIKQVRMVRQTSGTEMGWKRYYGRKRPAIPVPSGVKLSAITSTFDALDRVQGVAFADSDTLIDDGFSFEIDKGSHLYGLAPHGEILVLAMLPVTNVGLRGTIAARVKSIAQEFRLDLVAWPECQRLEPEDPAFVEYLTA